MLSGSGTTASASGLCIVYDYLLSSVFCLWYCSCYCLPDFVECETKPLERRYKKQRDTQLVSIMYRTHKVLPPSNKISSLYVFDALSRAAHHQAVKRGQVGDIKSKTGNCASFLLKVEGVLDGLFMDLVNNGTPEAKVSVLFG